MEPENNIQSGVPEVKPVANEAPKEDIFSNKSKKKTGMILGMVLFAILAIGGIGFGVWAMMDGDARVDALNKQIEDSKTQDNGLLAKIKEFENYEEDTGEDVEMDATIDTDADTDTDTDTGTGTDTSTNIDKGMDIGMGAGGGTDVNINTNTADYLYAGRWGLKVKIDDNLKEVEYALLYGSEDFSRLCVAGLASRASHSYKFASLYENFPGLACVVRGPSNYKSKDCESAFSIDNHNYCVLSNYLSKYSHTEDEIQLEKDSMKLVVDMLSNPDNYSAI